MRYFLKNFGIFVGPMKVEIQKYEEFEDFKFRDIFKVGEKDPKILLVSDSNAKIGHDSLNELDLNGFKVQTCKNQIMNSKIAMFKVKKLSDDFLYTFFRNQYDCAYFFTSDREVAASIFEPREPNTEIMFLNCISKELDAGKLEMIEKLFFKENEEVERHLKIRCRSEAEKLVEIKRLVHLYERLIDMIYYNSYKTKFALSLLMNPCLDVFILTGDEDVFKENNKFLNAKAAILHKNRNNSGNTAAFKKEGSVCLVLEYDDLFDSSLFEKCYFIVENRDEEESIFSRIESLRPEDFKIIKNIVLKQNKSNIANDLKIKDFEKYLKKNETELLNKILKGGSLEEKKYEAYRLSEVNIGSLFFPMSFSRQLLDSILHDLKSVLEKDFLFIRSVIPRVSSKLSGLLNKEYVTQIEVPGMFDFQEMSGFFATKKESVNDASYKLMRRLHQEKIVDENLSIIRKNVLKLKTIKRLFVSAYGTSDLACISKIYEEFSRDLKINCCGDVLIRNNRVILSKKNATSSFEHFKKKFIVDTAKDDVSIQDYSNSIKYKEIDSCGASDKVETATEKYTESNLESYFSPRCPSSKLERVYRKIPDSFSTKTDFMALYTLSNSNTGILCHESLKESCEIFDRHKQKMVVMSHLARQYSEEELKLLKFYQVIFFRQIGTIFPSSCQAFKLFYFAVPLKKDSLGSVEIDWDYLRSIYENFFSISVACLPNYSPLFKDNIIYNPFSSDFFVYAEALNYRIESKLGDTTFLDFFENKYKVSLKSRTGEMMFKAFSTKQVSAFIRKLNNVEHSKKVTKSTRIGPELVAAIIKSISLSMPKSFAEDQTEDPISSIPPFTCSNLNRPLNPDISLQNNNARPTDDSLNFDIETSTVCCSEACFVTPIKLSLLAEAESFKRDFYTFETAFIAHELIRSYDIRASPSIVFRCLTQSGENPEANYERLEFLGDCVLKFYSTNYLYLSFLPIEKIVSAKNMLISNANLFRICLETGIFKYVHFYLFNPKMVQAPDLSGVEDIVDFFAASPVFKSDNLGNAISKSFDPDVNVKKLYADVIEALLGAVYLESGYLEAIKFMHSIRLFNDLSQPPASEDSNISQHPNMNNGYLCIIRNPSSPFNGLLYKLFSYLGIIPLKDVISVQEIISYKFKNLGNLERAFVHPSYSPLLGSNDYDCLELIGDSALDLFVSSKLFNHKELDTPLLLHTAKISYVNNHSLYNIMIRTGLITHSKHKLQTCAAKKPVSDMFEALLGAILIDLDWNFNAFVEVMDRKVCLLLKQSCEVDAKYL